MISRLLLAFAALLMGSGGYIHAAAFGRARAALAPAGMAPFFANSFKALWLADSTTMFSLMLLFGLMAARPGMAGRPVVALLALIPAAIAALIYTFVGSFFAGHMLLITAAAVFAAGMLMS